MKKVKVFIIFLLMVLMLSLTSCGYSSQYRRLNADEQRLFNAIKFTAGAIRGQNKISKKFEEFKILEVEEELGKGDGYIVKVSVPNDKGKVVIHHLLVATDIDLDGWDILAYAYPDVEFTEYSDSKLNLYSFDIKQGTIMCIDEHEDGGFCYDNFSLFGIYLNYQNNLIANALQERKSHTKPTSVDSDKIIKVWEAYKKKYA